MQLHDMDKYDRRLLYLLDKNAKRPLKDLGEELHRSKSFVSYRMQRLEEHGIINAYQPIVDMATFGYFTFRVYFRFQQTTKEEGKQYVEYVKESLDQVWTITTMHGKWDYALFIGVKDIPAFHSIWDSIMESYKEKIKTYNVAIYAPVHNFNRTFFLGEATDVIERKYGIGPEQELDDLDKELIEQYALDARQSMNELAENVDATAETVRHRIAKMEEKKVITGYKLDLNTDGLGVNTYRVDVQLRSTERNAELFAYCRDHRNIYQVNKTIGGADFEFEIAVDDLSHLTSSLDQVKKEFKDVVNDMEYFGFSIFHTLKYIPD